MRRPPVRTAAWPSALLGGHRRGDARSLSTQDTGRRGLPSSRLRVGAAEAKRERQARTRVTFRKKTIRQSCPMPPCVPADVSGRCPRLSQRWLSLRRPRSKPSPVRPTNQTLRQADNSASLFPPLQPSRGSRVHHAVRPSIPCALLGRRLSLCHVPEPRPPVRAPLLFMMSEIGS